MNLSGRSRGISVFKSASVAGTLSCALILGCAVFSSCLFGIYTRPVDFLATVWPANAVMLGLMLRMPRAAGPIGWIAGSAAFLAADFLAGATVFKAVILASANLIGIAGTYFVISRFSRDAIELRTPESTLGLVLAVAVGSLLAGGVGAVANPILFGGTALGGLTFWFVTEFANYVAILPVILTASALPRWRRPDRFEILHYAAPVLALILACAIAVAIGGAGALALPVPALLWGALVYPRFVTALLTLAFSFWTLLALSAGYLPNTVDASNEQALISIRLGVSLIALAPIMLASVMSRQAELLERLRHLAAHDPLSGLFNRRAFRSEAEMRLKAVRREEKPVALLMLDIDHFKSINDSHGHAAGDAVISIVAERAAAFLRPTDVIGRIGGEEFAILLPHCTRSEALAVAERIRRAIADEPVPAYPDGALDITISVGLAAAGSTNADLDAMLLEADGALYAAKKLGRNRAETSGSA
ncbi:diguanylate cyclase [Nitratireductor indicus C115]|uniref:diguanylate cyclase n=1 Tax=Nitratireductor indicus C115 TaxID=1231190 RepID=K2P0S7_9HYPH|nr:GGDEF domain-containing protein [Nitratireductor indicus]EKF43799.1 diguanylate cyclase [Nitratireductor indicus C115]SFQ16731.1 diguanylate cyclase (GGDEF) domain-containing protein [Nitratireductor indicus]